MLSSQAKWSSDILDSQSTVYEAVPPPPKQHINAQGLYSIIIVVVIAVIIVIAVVIVWGRIG